MLYKCIKLYYICNVKIIKTYKFRIKDSTSSKKLNDMARSVNFVWNYCNEASIKSIGYHSKWLSGYDLMNLTSGCASDLGLVATTIQSICAEYAKSRMKAKKKKLNWRGKKSLGWIPFKSKAIKIYKDAFIYKGKIFKFWKSQEIQGKILMGSFNQDSQGKWYINIHCEVDKYHLEKTGKSVGIDLGLKTFAVTNEGVEYQNRYFLKYEEKLAIAQKANKKKRSRAINRKIANSRKDFLHKTSTALIHQYDSIFVGDVSSSKLIKTNMAKSTLDSGWGMFKSMLSYKAIRFGKDYHLTKENFSTVTCSECLQKTFKGGLSSLGVREWICSNCNTWHNRDVNAAKNILRMGQHTLIKGISRKNERLSIHQDGSGNLVMQQ